MIYSHFFFSSRRRHTRCSRDWSSDVCSSDLNLFWALERMKRGALESRGVPLDQVRARLLAEAQAIRDEDIAANQALGAHGAALVPANARILTHCNAGALATAGFGTALGVIRAAHALGRVGRVWVDETRPVMQGSRLTAWECAREGIPHTLIADVVAASLMSRGQVDLIECAREGIPHTLIADVVAASLMARGQVDLIVTGADRIAANGDTANKIGTYSLAVLADRKSTRLNSSHGYISYAVFCLKKKKKTPQNSEARQNED